MEFINYAKEYLLIFLLTIDGVIMSYLHTMRSSKELEAMTEKAAELEKQIQAIQLELSEMQACMKDFKALAVNLYNVHSARQFRNDMRKMYNTKARNQEIVRNHEHAQHSYKNAKDEFTEFVLTLC